MRVLHVHSGNLYGGVETLLLNLARCRHFCPYMQPQFALCFEGQIAEELRSAGVPVCILGAVRTRLPWTIWQARNRLRGLLEREHFDVVVCHSAWPQAIFGPLVRSAEIPLVFWLHNAARRRHWLELWAGRIRPDLVVCNSHFTSRTLDVLYPRIGHEVVYCPVSPTNGQELKDGRHSVRREFETPDDTPDDTVVIVQISRLERWKGQAFLFEALEKLRDMPNWVCWQVGGPQRPRELRYFKELQTLARRLGIANRVAFLGARSDISQVLTAAHIYCQPNTGPEPFGIALIEALLAGIPVVTSAMGGALEIVDESCGILVQPHDAAALASALRRLIKNAYLRSILGAAGRSRAEKLCDATIQIQRLHQVLSSAATQAAVAP